MNVTLIDEQTGARVLLHVAGLPQRCSRCRQEMLGQVIAHVEGGPPSWYCVKHIEEALAVLALPARARARLEARRQIHGKQPGDTVTVSRQLLAALDEI